MNTYDAPMRELLKTARSRNLGRSDEDFQRAFARHYAAGHAYTHLPIVDAKRANESPAMQIWRWHLVDIMAVAEGLKLPKRRGLYGFFNLDQDAKPTERVLYIGQSKQLKSRVTKQHTKFLLALRNRASHVGYLSINDSVREDIALEVVRTVETALIQHWSPYLNIEENYFNYEVEARLL